MKKGYQEPRDLVAEAEDRRAMGLFYPDANYERPPWTEEDFKKAEEVLKKKGYGKTLEDLKKLFQS